MNIRIARIRRNGHSLGVNLPSEVVRELGVRAGDSVSMGVSKGVLMLTRLATEDLERVLREQIAQRPGAED